MIFIFYIYLDCLGITHIAYIQLEKVLASDAHLIVTNTFYWGSGARVQLSPCYLGFRSCFLTNKYKSHKCCEGFVAICTQPFIYLF